MKEINEDVLSSTRPVFLAFALALLVRMYILFHHDVLKSFIDPTSFAAHSVVSISRRHGNFEQ